MHILIAAGLILALLGFLWLAHIVTNKKGLHWGLLVFLAPPVSFVFSAVYWERARYCVATASAGAFLLMVAIYFNGIPSAIAQIRDFGMHGAASNLESVYQSAQESISNIGENDEDTLNVVLIPQTEPDKPHYISKFVFKKLSLKKINNYAKHNVSITLKSGDTKNGILIERNQGKILLKRKLYSGSMIYSIDVADIQNVKVQLQQKIKA
ncbi:MAG: hypothetical protein D6B28_04230 [Gammaproteobacteria bacterium]|nr:MAG: hypothetical protein D6B28_04230 [Gammaproteobacteria bacterium]